MSDSRDVTPIGQLTGMPVLSLASGNRLGQIVDLLIDPVNGLLHGLTLSSDDGQVGGIGLDEIHSFGRDAVMARSDNSVVAPDSGPLARARAASKLVGTKIITEGGDMIGQITNIFVTLKPPPHIVYEARQSIIDKLLGREFFIPAAVGHALSDDGERLVVPDITTEIAVSDLANLDERRIEVRSFAPGQEAWGLPDGGDVTIPVLVEEDETLVRVGDDDDTVLRPPRRTEP